MTSRASSARPLPKQHWDGSVARVASQRKLLSTAVLAKDYAVMSRNQKLAPATAAIPKA